MGVYFRTKFHVSSIILTNFRQGVILPPNNAKRTPKKPTLIRANKNVALPEVFSCYFLKLIILLSLRASGSVTKYAVSHQYEEYDCIFDI